MVGGTLCSDHSMQRSMPFCKELNGEFPKAFTAYVTHFPCLNCTKQLLQVGCKRVVYIHQYRIDEYAEYLYREKEVELVNLPIEVVKEAIAEADFI